MDGMETFSRILVDLGLIQCKSDPCLFVLRNTQGELCAMVAVYCDDSIITGRSESVNMIKSRIKDSMSISDLVDLQRHLSIDYEFGTDEHGTYSRCSMDKYTTSMIDDFTEEFGSIRDFNTPGITGAPSTRSRSKDTIVEMERFRSFVGRLMIATGKSEPSISNACQEP